MLPRSTATNAANSAPINGIPCSQRVNVVGGLANFQHMSFGQCSRWVVDALSLYNAMRYCVNCVLAWSHIVKVCRRVVRFVAIFVVDVHAFWSWTNPSLRDERMNKVVLDYAINRGDDTLVSICKAWTQNSSNVGAAVSSSHSRTSATNAPKIGRFVETVKARSPFFGMICVSHNCATSTAHVVRGLWARSTPSSSAYFTTQSTSAS